MSETVHLARRIEFTVPLVPPSVNHYKTRFRNGRTVVSMEAIAFKKAVAVFCKGNSAQGKTFYCHLLITLGRKDRGDVDNFPKLVLDGLADCGAFCNKNGFPVSDAYVKHLVVVLDCDSRPERGETHIVVEAL